MPLSLSILNDKINLLTQRIDQLELAHSFSKSPKRASTYRSTTADPLLLVALRTHLKSLPADAYTQRQLGLPHNPPLHLLSPQSLNKLMRQIPERVTITRQRLYPSANKRTQLYLVGTPDERALQQTPEAVLARMEESTPNLPMYIALADHLTHFLPNTQLCFRDIKFPTKSVLKDPDYLTPPQVKEDITISNLLRLSTLPENLITLKITEDPDRPGSDFYEVVAA